MMLMNELLENGQMLVHPKSFRKVELTGNSFVINNYLTAHLNYYGLKKIKVNCAVHGWFNWNYERCIETLDDTKLKGLLGTWLQLTAILFA